MNLLIITHFQALPFEGRNALANDLNLDTSSSSGPKLPLLVEVLKRSQGEITGKSNSSIEVNFMLLLLL